MFLLSESQGWNLALAVLYVPYSLDSGTVYVCADQRMLTQGWGVEARPLFGRSVLANRDSRTPEVGCMGFKVGGWDYDSGLSDEQLLYRNVQWFRGGLVVKVHRLVYHPTLGLRVIKKKKATVPAAPRFLVERSVFGFRVSG